MWNVAKGASMFKYIYLLCVIFLTISTAQAANFELTSSRLTDKGKMPPMYTCEEGNHSPPLQWKNPPPGTKSFVLVFSSLDTPVGKIYLWILYNIPATLDHIPGSNERALHDVTEGKNTLNELGYRGPCPLDDKEHRFIFNLYALNTALDLPDGMEAEEVLERIRPHIIGRAKLRCVFNH